MRKEAEMAYVIPEEMLALYESQVLRANKAAVTYRELTSSKNDAVANVINTSDDEKIVQFREWRDSILAKIEEMNKALEDNTARVREYAEGLVNETDANPEDVKAEYLEARRAVTDMRAGLERFFGKETVARDLDERGVEEVTNLRGTGSRGGTTGIKRPRLVAATVNGEDVPAGTTGQPTFTTMAQYVSKTVGKVDANSLKAAAFKAAGTEDLSERAGETISFNFEVAAPFEGQNKVVAITVTPKATDAEASASADESDED